MGIFNKKSKEEQNQLETEQMNMAMGEVPEGSEDGKDISHSDTYLIDKATTHFTTVDNEWLNAYERKAITYEAFKAHVMDYIVRISTDEEQADRIYEGFNRYLTSYGILDALIDDPTISDIKTYSFDNIRIKRNGKREQAPADIKYSDERAYRQAISRIAVKNKVSLSTQNALQTFTDKNSNKGYILRFTITTDFVNTKELPCMHIRKIPKTKYTTEQLINLGFMTPEQARYLIDRARNSDGMLFCGKGAAGKTTCMNWLIDYIPRDQSGLVIQENEELFSNHPDLLFQHTVVNKGEGKIEYGLSDLARNGLLMDLDYFVIGEIKGGEAVYLLNAVYTGHKGWASVHGASSTEAMDKLVDYIKYNSDYSKEEAMEMLTHLNTVVFMNNFKVTEVSEVVGFNRETGRLDYKRVF